MGLLRIFGRLEQFKLVEIDFRFWRFMSEVQELIDILKNLKFLPRLSVILSLSRFDSPFEFRGLFRGLTEIKALECLRIYGQD